MNCQQTIMEYLENNARTGNYREFTASELSHRVTVIPGGGPRYDISTVRRALERLAWHDKVDRRWAGGKYLWKLKS
jgi:hypothetical protein